MRDSRALEEVLRRIDGLGYKAYRDIRGSWSFGDFELDVDHVQGDPFAAPSRVRVTIESADAAFDPASFRTRARAVGTAAYLARRFAEAARSAPIGGGTGRSGEIRMEDPGQVVLPQTAVTISERGDVEARFSVGLPAEGRRISGDRAVRLLGDTVPDLVRRWLFASPSDAEQVERHASANEDADALRDAVVERGLVAFLADGALLPRRSGVDDRLLEDDIVVPFRSPDSLRVEIEVPNAGRVTGLGIPGGVTLIVGGGFHGKSTLLRALQDGVYNHGPDDGRELVVSHPDTVKVRAEDGRAVAGVDISPFIDDLPLGRDTTRFSTSNASGSTSQAAAIVEAIEAGAAALLIDEDTSATNFMIRDRRMQELVPKPGEPITPLVDRVRELHVHAGVSTVIVLGGSGDYLGVADHVIRMADYAASDVTPEAHRVAERHATGRVPERRRPLERPKPRAVVRATIDPRKGRRARGVKVPDGRTLLFGTEKVDLVAVEQIASRGQTRAIGHALAWISEAQPADEHTVAGLLDAVERVLHAEGLDGLAPGRFGDLSRFRRHELAATLNRLRSLRVE